MNCKNCGEITEGKKQWCCLECMRRYVRPERYKLCVWCKKEFYQKEKSVKYCSQTCAHRHNGKLKVDAHKPEVLEMVALGASRKDIQKDLGMSWSTIMKIFDDEKLPYETKEEKELKQIKKQLTKDQKERLWIANVLREFRRGVSLEDAFSTLQEDLKGRSIHGLINKHCRLYKKISKKRRKESLYVKREKRIGCRSKIFNREHEFRDYVSDMFGGETEVNLMGKTGRRCDVVANILGVKYAIECKVVTRTGDVDAAIGQAMISSDMLNIKPAVAFPSDCHLDADAHDYLIKQGIKIIRDVESIPIVRRGVSISDKGSPSQWWKGMYKTWLSIKGTSKANPESMIDLGFSKMQVSSCLGIPIGEL